MKFVDAGLPPCLSVCLALSLLPPPGLLSLPASFTVTLFLCTLPSTRTIHPKALYTNLYSHCLQYQHKFLLPILFTLTIFKDPFPHLVFFTYPLSPYNYLYTTFSLLTLPLHTYNQHPSLHFYTPLSVYIQFLYILIPAPCSLRVYCLYTQISTPWSPYALILSLHASLHTQRWIGKQGKGVEV